MATVYPKKAVNIEGKYVFIVNDKQYRQAVEIEQCLGEGEECLNDSDAPAPSTVCRQKYATYRMYVINEEGEQVYDSFSLPSACLCHHKSEFAIRNDLKTEANNNLPFCPTAESLSIPNITETTATTTAAPETTKKPVRKIAAVKFGDRKRRHVRPGLHPHKCLNGNSYCESEMDYPDNIILRALEKNKELSVDLFQ